MLLTQNGTSASHISEQIVHTLPPLWGAIERRSTERVVPHAASLIELTAPPAEWSERCRHAAEFVLTRMVETGATDLFNSGPALTGILSAPAAAPVSAMAAIISSAVKNDTALSVGFPSPEVLFPLVKGDEGFAAWAFSSFILQAEYIGTVAEDIANSPYAPSGRMQLTIVPDGGFLLAWMDTQQERIHQLKL